MDSITVAELKKLRDNNEKHQLIDVRENDEYQICNIGGLLIPIGDIPKNLDKISDSSKIIVMCRSGKRSAQICNYLKDNGYKEVYNLSGGILKWADEIDNNITKY